jgi:hypothetical protein
MILRRRLEWVIALFLLGALAATARAEDAAGNKRLFMPAVLGGRPAPLVCDIPNTNYAALSISGPPLTVDPERDENLNLGHRGYERTEAPLQLVTYDGPVMDTKAPQLPGMFGDRRTPTFTNAYQRYRWDEGCDCPLDTYSRWPVTVLGMGVRRGETIYTPDSGYDIGGGYEYQVMYAAETRVTLHIGREDEFPGYVIHVEDVCVDPDLLALYRQLHAAGRGELPALRGHQPFGKALGNEIKVAMRDTGSFMDPRSRNDWWQGR